MSAAPDTRKRVSVPVDDGTRDWYEQRARAHNQPLSQTMAESLVAYKQLDDERRAAGHVAQTVRSEAQAAASLTAQVVAEQVTAPLAPLPLMYEDMLTMLYTMAQTAPPEAIAYARVLAQHKLAGGDDESQPAPPSRSVVIGGNPVIDARVPSWLRLSLWLLLQHVLAGVLLAAVAIVAVPLAGWWVLAVGAGAGLLFWLSGVHFGLRRLARKGVIV